MKVNWGFVAVSIFGLMIYARLTKDPRAITLLIACVVLATILDIVSGIFKR